MIYLLILLPIIAANVVYWYFRKNKKLDLSDERRGYNISIALNGSHYTNCDHDIYNGSHN